MPLIMEDSINVDDLFGEPSSLDLGLPSPVSTKGLAKRLDEMRLSGCCQYVVIFFYSVFLLAFFKTFYLTLSM